MKQEFLSEELGNRITLTSGTQNDSRFKLKVSLCVTFTRHRDVDCLLCVEKRSMIHFLKRLNVEILDWGMVVKVMMVRRRIKSPIAPEGMGN